MSIFQVNTPSYQYRALWHSPCLSDCESMNQVEYCCSVTESVTWVKTLWSHELQHIRLPCPSLSPGVCSNSCPLSQWCHPTISCSLNPFSSCPQSFPEFSSQSTLCIRWPRYWSLGFSISPSNEYSVLISFRIDRLDLLAVQGILKNLLQHHSSKA